jgi:hypothetical protein
VAGCRETIGWTVPPGCAARRPLHPASARAKRLAVKGAGSALEPQRKAFRKAGEVPDESGPAAAGAVQGAAGRRDAGEGALPPVFGILPDASSRWAPQAAPAGGRDGGRSTPQHLGFRPLCRPQAQPARPNGIRRAQRVEDGRECHFPSGALFHHHPRGALSRQPIFAVCVPPVPPRAEEAAIPRGPCGTGGLPQPRARIRRPP